jgi:hypothetical protein
MLKSTCAALMLTFGLTCHAADLNEQKANPTNIRVISTNPTPEPEHVTIKIIYPRPFEVRGGSNKDVQVRIDGFALGVNSDFPRKREIYNDPDGQSLHFVIDNQPHFSRNIALVSALDDSENYFEQTMEFPIPGDLDPGLHVLRVFPVRSFNESLKGDGCFAARVFYYQSETCNDEFRNQKIDLDAPYITYNEPQGKYKFSSTHPILLDFYVSNTQLSRDGYKVRLSIDGGGKRLLTQWIPYYIYGMKRGTHKIRLQLLDPQNKLVPGPLNDVTRTIMIE